MNNLIIAINTLLETIHPQVYFQVASKKADYPYLVFDLPNSFLIEDQEIFNLDIDVWDKPDYGDTTVIENLAESIWNTLHKYKIIDANMQVSIYRQNRLILIDDDPRIRRRRLTLQLKYFKRF